METISPVNREVNGNIILYPGTLKRGSHEKELENESVTLLSDWSQCSLSRVRRLLPHRM